MDDVKRQSDSPEETTETVTFLYFDDQGVEHEVSGHVGQTLMAIAKDHAISGIDGDCRGNCACGTCCIEISSSATSLNLADAGVDERDLLSFVKDSPASFRLGCQIALCPELAGAKVKVATS